MRSLIQLSGRVWRHRYSACHVPNVMALSTNLRHFKNQIAYRWPGFENTQWRLGHHDLEKLLAPEIVPQKCDAIDSRPRIRAADTLRPTERLSDLEHTRMRDMMLPRVPAVATRRSPPTTGGLNAASWWNHTPADALLTGVIQQRQPFRDDTGQKEVDVVLLPNDDTGYVLNQYLDKTKPKDLMTSVQYKLHSIPNEYVQGVRIQPWGETKYMQALQQLAGDMKMSMHSCALKFGTTRLIENDKGWRFHPALGFAKAKN